MASFFNLADGLDLTSMRCTFRNSKLPSDGGEGVLFGFLCNL